MTKSESKEQGALRGPAEFCSLPKNITLHEFYQRSLHRIDSGSVALIGSEKITFSELELQSNRLAAALRDFIGNDCPNQNPDAEYVIGVCLPPSEKLVLLLFAILKLGAAYMPIDASFPSDRIKHVVGIARPILIVTDTETTAKDKFEHVEANTRLAAFEELHKNCEIPKNSIPTPLSSSIGLALERTAIVLFTSGSSGTPKGVRLSHLAIMNRLHWQWKAYPFGPGEVVCFKTALTFVDSVAEIFGALLHGVPLVVIPKHVVQQPQLFVQEVKKHQISRLTVVPSLLESMLTMMDIEDTDTELEPLRSVSLWVCSGEALTHQLLTRFFKRFPQGKTLCNFYGSTEVMGDVTHIGFSSLEDVQRKCVKVPDFETIQVPLGIPIFNTTIHVLNDQLEPTSGLGEVCITGWNLATGYVGVTSSDKLITNPHWNSTEYRHERLYRTGDYGQIATTSDGTQVLLFKGRIDSQIKVRGHRVDLSDVEAAIKALSEVEHGVVLCYHAGRDDQAIIAFVVPPPGFNAANISALVKSKLLPYQMPVVRSISEIPKLVNGKIDRQLLLQQYHQEMQTRDQFSTWENVSDIAVVELPRFQALVKTISFVTGTPIHAIVSDLQATFFDVGGTSLNSLNVIAQLKEQNVHVSITDFVSAKSILHLHHICCSLPSSEVENPEINGNASNGNHLDLFSEMLHEGHKDQVLHLIATSFSKKGDLDAYVGITYEDHFNFLSALWSHLLMTNLCFIVKSFKDSKRIIAVSLNFDSDDEPNVSPPPALTAILEFLDYCESSQRDTVPVPKTRGTLLHNFMMGTDEQVSYADNIQLIAFMEEENIRIGKANNFQGLLTTNTSQLTQSIAKDLLDYHVLSEVQANSWSDSEGNQPFGQAPDSLVCQVCWKDLRS